MKYPINYSNKYFRTIRKKKQKTTPLCNFERPRKKVNDRNCTQYPEIFDAESPPARVTPTPIRIDRTKISNSLPFSVLHSLKIIQLRCASWDVKTLAAGQSHISQRFNNKGGKSKTKQSQNIPPLTLHQKSLAY